MIIVSVLLKLQNSAYEVYLDLFYYFKIYSKVSLATLGQEKSLALASPLVIFFFTKFFIFKQLLYFILDIISIIWIKINYCFLTNFL